MNQHGRSWGRWFVLVAGMAALLTSLAFVAWRQNRAREAMAMMDAMERQIALFRAEQAELSLRIQRLESRGYVVQEARARLGMVAPGTDQLVLILPGEGAGAEAPDSVGDPQ